MAILDQLSIGVRFEFCINIRKLIRYEFRDIYVYKLINPIIMIEVLNYYASCNKDIGKFVATRFPIAKL